METGSIVLATEHDRLVLVTIETGARLVTLRADTAMWHTGGDSIRIGSHVEFEREGQHLVGIKPFGARGAYATQRHPRWDKGETWEQVRSARP